MIDSPRLKYLRQELARLEIKSAKLAQKRSELPPGSPRSRVTSANAQWSRAAEAREMVRHQIEELEREGSDEEEAS